MTTQLARLLDAIPLVSTTTERDQRFPSPSIGQRVQNLETALLERFSGAGWVGDSLGGGLVPLLSVTPGPLVVGTDPGGSDLLRVGGAAFVNGAFVVQPPSGYAYMGLVQDSAGGSGGEISQVFYGPAGSVPSFLMYHAGGSAASPQPTPNTHWLGFIDFGGRDHAGLDAGARFRSNATQTWSASTRAANLICETVAVNQTSLVTRWQIANNGAMAIGPTLLTTSLAPAPILLVDGSAYVGTAADQYHELRVESQNDASGNWTGVSLFDYGPGGVPFFYLHKARGTRSIPSAPLNNDIIGGMYIEGYTNAIQQQVAFWQVIATENWGASAKGAKWEFHVARAGEATAPVKIMSLFADAAVFGPSDPGGAQRVRVNGGGLFTAPLEVQSAQDPTTPDFTFQADTNTGIYQVAVDRLGFATAGSGRWEVDDSGHFVPITTLAVDLGLATKVVRNAYVQTFVGGIRKTFEEWYQDNVTASQSAVALTRFGAGVAFPTKAFALHDGSLLSVWVKSSEARTAGTLTVEVYKNGVATGLTAVLDGTNTTYKLTTQAPDVDTHTAGDDYDIRITTDAGWTPTTADIRAGLEIEE